MLFVCLLVINRMAGLFVFRKDFSKPTYEKSNPCKLTVDVFIC